MNKDKLRQNVSIGLAVAVAVVAVSAGVIKNQREAAERAVAVSERRVKAVNIADYRVANGYVEAVGQVDPKEKAELRSQLGGEVIEVLVGVGDEVYQGQTLVRLSGAGAYAQVQSAEAAVKTQQARLTELNKGTRSETVSLKELEISKAKSDLVLAYQGAVNALRDAYAKADGAVRQQTDAMFNGDESPSPSLTFTSLDSQAASDAVYERTVARETLNDWQAALAMLNGSEPAVVTANLSDAKGYIAKLQPLFERLSAAIEKNATADDLTENQMKSAVNAARQTMTGLVTSINAQQSSLAAQILGIDRLRTELDLMKSGATDEQVQMQEAALAQANAGLSAAYDSYSKTVIRASVPGKVLSVDVSRGDLVSPGQSIASVVNDSGMEIVLHLSGNDLGLINVGSDVLFGENGRGAIERIAPAIDSATGKTEVSAVITDKGAPALQVGETVTVRVAVTHGNGQSESWLLPLTAVRIYSDANPAIFAVGDDGIVHKREVTVGEVVGERVFVSGNLGDVTRLAANAADLEDMESVVID